MNTLILLKGYNNYFNRTVKLSWETTATEFLNTHPDLISASFSDINFNPNDFINTEQIINFNEEWCPDYLIVTDEDDNILHTWFIIESQRTRLGQYRIVLRRDLINDYYDYLYDAPTFIEKGTVPPTDSAIFNSEGMQFNQIKRNEYLLKDESNIAWLVGYTSRPTPTDTDTDYRSISLGSNLEFDVTASDFEFNDYIGQEIYTIPTQWNLDYTILRQYNSSQRKFTLMDGSIVLNRDVTSATVFNGNDYFVYAGPQTQISPYYNYNGNSTVFTSNLTIAADKYLSELKEGVQNATSYLIDSENILKYNGKILYDSSEDKYFKLVVDRVELKTSSLIVSDFADLNIAMTNVNTDFRELMQSETIGGTNNSLLKLNFDSYTYRIRKIEIPGSQLESKIYKTHQSLNDAPYDMFCIPYGEINIKNIDSEAENADTLIGKSTEYTSLKFAQKIAENLGTALYDMQLLPYCPIPGIIRNQEIRCDLLSQNYDYSLLQSSTSEMADSILIWCPSSNGQVIIPFNYFVEDYKLENECDMWRICSPNYQGIFEFSAAKNRGINYFQVDYTYKPYNPYIHVAPNWGGLYGENFNDARGLILGGDFSVATVSDAFKQYEITNKNYQNIFDRGIKNMDTMRKYQAIDETIGAIAGSFQTSATGFMLGGGWGAAIGGVAGLGAGMGDVAISAAKYRENKSYQTDLYNFNLQNVKALPDSLTKSSALTYNNKLFPFLEYYSCTDEEKEALKNKIRYNGMTIMRIEPLGNYLVESNGSNFIQGQIIKINDNICDDSHLSLAIYEEIKRGVFI